ncbi:carbohydrate ABC transporter permease [Sulfobacillus sp. DSM 109850]|uniref:Carbohydrate ABC transporter permease n=2 Tax=Sulfobacillus harzensis TaxID=2729629 RepID=A0A7Y0L776_9FIRM|nr:carbohydrate ABC transporter permease [Sulfobacillus harzensis]
MLRGFRAVVALAVALSFLFPLYIALVTSMDTPAHVFTFPPHLVPDFNFRPYVEMWHMGPWLMYFKNTVFITATTIVIALATSVLGAYALTFFEFKGRNALFMVVLLVMMVPAEALLIPNYIVLHEMNLLNTLWAQILPFGGSVFGVFLLRQVFLSLPKSYWDAARIDGASHLRFLWSVALPQARPVLFTIGLYIGIGSWNSFQWPYIVTTSRNVQPLEVEIQRLLSTQSVEWRRLSAAGIMVTMPLVIVYLFVQKYIVRGLSRGEGLQE